jgi:FKBP12-rapamycin complex-associated protein
VYEEAVRGLSQVSVDIIHGSLLAFRCLLNHSMKFMEDSKYRETFELIFRLREHKEPMIRKVVILAIAGLASYDSDLFARDYLSPSMEFILISLRKEKEKSTCKFPSASFSSYWSVFNAIGEIVQSVKSGITDYLPSILALIKESLSPVRRSVRSIHFFLFWTIQSGKVKVSVEPAVFHCVGTLCKALGGSIFRQLPEIIDLMFQTGLSEVLVNTVSELSKIIPQLHIPIQGILIGGPHYYLH